MIIALHPQTDTMTAELTNKGDRLFWDDRRKHEVSGPHTFEFTMLADSGAAPYFDQRARFLVPAKNGGFYEYVVYETETNYPSNEKHVFGIATYPELNKQKIIPPQNFSAWSLEQYAHHAFQNTEWRPGRVEYSGISSLNLENYVGAYDFLMEVQKSFTERFEINFRVEISNRAIAGRYVDFVERLGSDTPKEIVAGKDIIEMSRKVFADRIITGLFVVGPEPVADEARLTMTIADDAAFQRWNRNGNHVLGVYEISEKEKDSAGKDIPMTTIRLEALGRAELERRIAAVMEYDITTAYLGHLFPEEDVNLGDRFRVINTDMEPPLYAVARAIAVEESITAPETNTYTIGEVVEYAEEDILAAFRQMQRQYGITIHRDYTPPSKTDGLWILPGQAGKPDIGHTWDPGKGEWVPITPTKPEDIGALPEDQLDGRIDQKIDEFVVEYDGAKITHSINPPVSPKVNELWVDISQSPYVWKRWTGSAWVKAIATSISELNGLLAQNQLAQNAVAAINLQPNAVTETKIAEDAITTPKIATNAITANEIASLTITSNEIATGAITAGKIFAGAVTAEKIAANSITSTMISTAGLDAGVIKVGTLTGVNINVSNNINVGNQITLGAGLGGGKFLQFGSSSAAIAAQGDNMDIYGSWVRVQANQRFQVAGVGGLSISTPFPNFEDVLILSAPDSTYANVASFNRRIRISPQGAGLFEFFSASNGDSMLRGAVNGVMSSIIKWTSTGMQIRTQSDAGLASLVASNISAGSLRESKRDIEPFAEDALGLVKETQVYEYRRIDSPEAIADRRFVGLIYDEAPDQIARDEAIDLYGMSSILWKAVQQLSAEIEELKNGKGADK